MQEQMLGGKGFLVIGYLLEKVWALFGFVLSISPVFLLFSVTWLKGLPYLWYKTFFYYNTSKLSIEVFSSSLSSYLPVLK